MNSKFENRLHSELTNYLVSVDALDRPGEGSLKKMEFTEAYWELGWCQEHLGSLEEALNSYKRAALIDSSLEWPQKRIEL